MRVRLHTEALGSALAVAMAAGATLAGCTAHEPAPDFQSTDSAARLAAIRRAAALGDRDSVRDLISRLDSDDPAERLLGSRALERITGQTNGYDYAAPKPERDAAVGRWVSWYAAPKTARSGSGGAGAGGVEAGDRE